MTLATVGQIHNKRALTTTRPQLTLQEAAQIMSEKNIGALPVIDPDGKLIGIISERDIVRQGVARICNLCEVTVGEVMTRKVCVVDPDEDYRVGLAKMQNTDCRHLPIVKDNKPVGMVSMRDLLSHQLKDYEFDVKMLEKYITS